MKALDYLPQAFTPEELSEAWDMKWGMNTAIIVNTNGTVELSRDFTPDVIGTQGPEDPTIESANAWTFWTRGMTGQHGYSGPEMHESEVLTAYGSRLILSAPGEYALVPVRYECSEGMCGDLWEDGESDCGDIHFESWCIIFRNRNAMEYTTDHIWACDACLSIAIYGDESSAHYELSGYDLTEEEWDEAMARYSLLGEGMPAITVPEDAASSLHRCYGCGTDAYCQWVEITWFK